MDWCFATINNRLAEIYFEKQKGGVVILGHCYVEKSEFKTKKELKFIKEDSEYVQLTYWQGKYRSKNPKLKLKAVTRTTLAKYETDKFFDAESTFE